MSWHEERLAAERQAVIVVLGARSGTSALAGVLGLLGCTLPNRMMAANFGNTKGYFEPQDLADLHDRVLASVGSSWDDWREFPREWFKSDAAKVSRAAIIAAYRQNYPRSPLAVLKEPRMCRLLPLWRDAFAALDVLPVFCFIDRSPIEVARSLQARDGSTMEHGLRYYIRNHLDAERDTRWFRRSFLSYPRLLSNWRSEIIRASNELGVSLLPTPGQAENVGQFLEHDMRHVNLSPDDYPDNGLRQIAFAIHDAYGRLARSDPQHPIHDELDQIRVRFEALRGP